MKLKKITAIFFLITFSLKSNAKNNKFYLNLGGSFGKIETVYSINKEKSSEPIIKEFNLNLIASSLYRFNPNHGIKISSIVYNFDFEKKFLQNAEIDSLVFRKGVSYKINSNGNISYLKYIYNFMNDEKNNIDVGVGVNFFKQEIKAVSNGKNVITNEAGEDNQILTRDSSEKRTIGFPLIINGLDYTRKINELINFQLNFNFLNLWYEKYGGTVFYIDSGIEFNIREKISLIGEIHIVNQKIRYTDKKNYIKLENHYAIMSLSLRFKI